MQSQVHTASSPVLAEAADVLSDQLRLLLVRLSQLLRPEADRLEARFLARLEKLSFDVRQRRALSSLTLGAAARFLARGCPPADFFEEVEYHGRRLAKLNLPPSGIVVALGEYDKLLTPVLKKLMPNEHENFQWVREQLQFCVMLTLNNAYYQVRETETQAFYEMFWAELDTHLLDDLLERLLAILARFSKADQAHLYLVDFQPQTPAFVVRCASYGTDVAPKKRGSSQTRSPVRLPLQSNLSEPRCFSPEKEHDPLALDPTWESTFSTCWSVPMMAHGRLAGAIQFGFVRPYEWLPREQELLTAAAERCVRAAEKARLMQDLGERETQVRRLAERMMHVEEIERRRISRELHDQTGQDLLWIRLQMEMIEQELPDSEQKWKSRLAGIRDMTERTIVEIRRLIAALSPAVLEQLGLAAALRQLITRFRNDHQAKMKLQIGRIEPLSKQMEVVVYRLVQECLNNIIKHSFCSNVNISLYSADGLLCLSVEDDGVGFQVEEGLKKPGSFGLAGIRERAALLGGRCLIESRPLSTQLPTELSTMPNPKNQKEARTKAQTRTLNNGINTMTAKTPSSGTKISIELPVRPLETKASEDAQSRRRVGLAAAGLYTPGPLSRGLEVVSS